MGDRFPASSRSTDRGLRGAPQSSSHLSGTLAFDDWSYAYSIDGKAESVSHPSSHLSPSYKQPASLLYNPQSAVGHEGQLTASQRASSYSTTISPFEGTPRASFRERPMPITQQQGGDGGRGRESPTAFLSRILSEPRPSPSDRRQTLMKEWHGDHESMERAEKNARLASFRWERGGEFACQPDRASKTALATVPASASSVSSAQRHAPPHEPSTNGQTSTKVHEDYSSISHIHPARRQMMTTDALSGSHSDGNYSGKSGSVSEPEEAGVQLGPHSATSTNMLPVQGRKILPVSRPRPQDTTHSISTYTRPDPPNSLHSSSSYILGGACGIKRAQLHAEPPVSKRTKTLEEIKRVEEENKRLIHENRTIEFQIERERTERLRQEKIKRAAQELQLRALEAKNAKLKHDNMLLKSQLGSTQRSDMRASSMGRSSIKAVTEGPRILSRSTEAEAPPKLQSKSGSAGGSPRSMQALEGARLALEQMEVETQTIEKDKDTTMVKARDSNKLEEKGEEDQEMGMPVKMEVDATDEPPFAIDCKDSEGVKIKMEEF